MFNKKKLFIASRPLTRYFENPKGCFERKDSGFIALKASLAKLKSKKPIACLDNKLVGRNILKEVYCPNAADYHPIIYYLYTLVQFKAHLRIL